MIFFGLDTHTWSANISSVKGDHTIKMGYEYRLMSFAAPSSRSFFSSKYQV